jgi:DNA primase
MTILTLLQQVLGPHKSFPNGENYFMCPFCHNAKKKFAVNEHSLKWHCWHCNARGSHVIWLLRQMNVPKSTIQQFKECLGDVNLSQYKPQEQKNILTLPSEYRPLWIPQKSFAYKSAIRYVKNRKLAVDDILRYRIGYCETGPYAGRIVIPSYDEHGRLNYFTARTFYDGGMKYKNPPASKNVVCFENMVDWSEPVILCEGMFDAIALRRNAIPLLGKTLSRAIEHALLKNNTTDVIVFLDVDARHDALELEQHLRQYDINTKVVLTEHKDASDMGFDVAWTEIQNASTTTFGNYIKQRLLTI